MPPAPEEEIERAFPALVGVPWEIASPQDATYNCVAFALEDTERWWWPLSLPSSGAYWPADLERLETVDAFRGLLETLGFWSTGSESFVEGVSQIALFAKGSRPTHVAVQRVDGRWASKLGTQWDIIHPLSALEGDEYGLVTDIFARSTR